MNRCQYCDDTIDPRNHERTRQGYACLPCADERAREPAPGCREGPLPELWEGPRA